MTKPLFRMYQTRREKYKACISVFLVLSVLFAFSLFYPKTSQVQAATDVLYGCAEIVTPGNYVLGATIVGNPTPPFMYSDNACIYVHDVDGFELDCQGYGVSTNNLFGGAVRLVRVRNFIVRNCNLVSAVGETPIYQSLYIGQSDYGLIVDNQLGGATISPPSYGDSNGIGSSHIAVTQNSFTYSLYALNSTDINIYNNTITVPRYPTSPTVVGLNGGGYNNIYNNYLDGGWDGTYPGFADDVIVVDTEVGDRIFNNTIKNAWDCGIETAGPVDKLEIFDNHISNANYCGVGGWWKSNMWNNSTVRDNTFENVGRMFWFYSAGTPLTNQPLSFSNNVFENNNFAVSNNFYEQSSPSSIFDLPATYRVENNTFTNNNFNPVRGTPYLSPQAGFVDGGGNLCAPGTDPNYPLDCGRPAVMPPAVITVIGVSPNPVLVGKYAVASTTVQGNFRLGLSYSWSKVSGPGLVKITQPDQTATELAFDKPGDYVLRFTVTDRMGRITTAQVAVSVVNSVVRSR